ncbi:MAG: hypothetical protein KJ077_49870 [Anaerolineae bacterium]|nr:hypothetical protein [Anaerolineae bacterium]
MSLFDKPPRYRSYLLTFWEERSQNPAAPRVWRFSLQDPHSGRRYGFGSMSEMTTFLQTELDNNQDDLPDCSPALLE